MKTNQRRGDLGWISTLQGLEAQFVNQSLQPHSLINLDSSAAHVAETKPQMGLWNKPQSPVSVTWTLHRHRPPQQTSLQLHQHTYTHTHTDTDRRFCWYDKCCDCWRMPDFLLLNRASHCKNCGSYIFNLITSSDFAGLIRVYIRGVNFGCVCMIVFEKRVAVNLQTNTHPFAEKLCVEFLKISDK